VRAGVCVYRQGMPNATDSRSARSASWPVRLGLLAAFLAMIAIAYASGLHRELSLETLVRNRARIDSFVAAHYLGSLAIFIGIYIATVALSIPAALLLTISGGILFGPVVGALAAVTGATIGGAIVFMVAKTALGEHLLRRAGPLAGKLADGFRANAFSYLLFLRLAPVFPFWLVNLAPALFGVPLRTFVGATVLGIAPASFAFAFVGSGLDSAIAAQQAAYKECLAAGGVCHINFDVGDAVTPQLLIALGALAVVSVLPVVLKRLAKARA
jgi:uncharacterized membrane protein YdjX (TVP38/TMEM64 family)